MLYFNYMHALSFYDLKMTFDGVTYAHTAPSHEPATKTINFHQMQHQSHQSRVEVFA